MRNLKNADQITKISRLFTPIILQECPAIIAAFDTIKGEALNNADSAIKTGIPFVKPTTALLKGGVGATVRNAKGSEGDFIKRAEASRRRLLREPSAAERAGVDAGTRFREAAAKFTQAGATLQETTQGAIADTCPQQDGKIVFALNAKAGECALASLRNLAGKMQEGVLGKEIADLAQSISAKLSDMDAGRIKAIQPKPRKIMLWTKLSG